MEVNTKKNRFQFDDNYNDIIENSSIVQDFDKFIDMANDGLLELSKSGILSMSSAIIVNETILRTVPVRLKRPMIKSFPNERNGFFEFDSIMNSIAAIKKKWEANKSNDYFFKANLGKAWRIYKVDYRSSLDDLCFSILKSFNFDFDHLYDVTFMSSFGYRLTFNGAPDISYAEYPTTEDILIGDLPIKINDMMNFTFDYGDNWQFSIVLEKIEIIKKETNKIPDIEIIEIKGKAPKQYPIWD